MIIRLLCLLLTIFFVNTSYAQLIDHVKYPVAVDTINKKLAFLIKAKEKLRLEANQKKKEWRDGLISDDAIKAYLEDFHNKRHKISIAILKHKSEFKKDNTYDPNLEDILK